MPSSSLRTALLSIHSVRSSSSSTLASTTHNILRTSLADEHGMKWTNEEWKQGGARKMVGNVWQEILQENLPQTSQITLPDSSSPVIISKPTSKKPSKKPRSKSIKESDEEEEVVEEPKKKKRKISNSASNGNGKESEKKDKYSRAAEKNLGGAQNFMGMIGDALGDALGLGAADEEEEEEEGDEASSDVMIMGEEVQDENDSEDSSTPQPQPLAKSKPKKSRSSTSSNAEASTSKAVPPPKKKSKSTSEGMDKPKKRRVSKGKGKEDSYKSTEFVGDSDDSSHSVDREVLKKENKSSSKSKGKGKKKEVVDSDDSDSDSDGEEKGKGKGRGKGQETKKTTNTRTRKEPVRKEGDAEKGTESEESRIKQMKVLLKHAGTTRPFTASTGAERTLSAEERTQHLEGLLDGLGLIAKGKGKSSKGERKLASESKAKSVGHLRELEKETEALQGSAIHTGLRTGKALHPDTSSDDDEKKGKGKSGKKGGGTPQRKKLEERKKFASFLGDQSESD